MIDICTVIHRNYQLFELQLKNWSWIEGEKRILFCDNTPYPERRLMTVNDNYSVSHEWINYEASGTDGESHGGTLDHVIKFTNTPIIGIVDSDFFWLKRDILSEVEKMFNDGVKCVGVENWYNDFEIVNQKYPERASYLAPSVFGMFIDRELAQETFVSTRVEGSDFMAEVGWRIRKKIIEEKIPCHTYLHYQHEKQPDPAVCYFGTPDMPIGIHFLKCSNPAFGRNVGKMFKEFKLDQMFGCEVKEEIPKQEIIKPRIISLFSP